MHDAMRVLDAMEAKLGEVDSPGDARMLGSMRNDRFRGSLDWEERVSKAERQKEAANEKFKAGENEAT